MDKLKYLLIVTNLFSLVAVVYLLTSNPDSRSAYFLSTNVYNEFEYKKELEAELQFEQQTMQTTLDSLENDLKQSIMLLQGISPTQEQINALQIKQNNYIDYRDQVEGNYTTKVEEYYALIWDRINSYVKEFGEQKGYQYIFGANGDGSIMYADASSDITSEVIEYINQRYEGE